MPSLKKANPGEATTSVVSKSASQRIVSLDAMRGFDMIMILGIDEPLVPAIAKMCHNRFTSWLAVQYEHCAWIGFHFEDLIFPLFLFMAGVSMTISIRRTIDRAGRWVAVRRIFRRGALLVALGIFYYGGLSQDWHEVRWFGVLQRIGLAYLFAGLLFCFFRWRGLLASCIIILIGYWGLMTFVPIRDVHMSRSAFERIAQAQGIQIRDIRDEKRIFLQIPRTVRGKYEPGYNVDSQFDFQYLPGKLWLDYSDPEGILGTIPAIASCLLGVLAGLLLRSGEFSDRVKLALLTGIGAACLALGFVWGLQFPVIKIMWTSSYVLVAGGYSFLLLAAFWWIVDLRGWKRWAVPFIWIGVNPITLYMLSNIVPFDRIVGRFIGGPISGILDAHIATGMGTVAIATCSIALILLCAWFLNKKQIYLRV